MSSKEGEKRDAAPVLRFGWPCQRSLVEYCRTRRLSLLERLRLIDEVCGLVAANHSNLRTFRDLKTEHVVVLESDDIRTVEVLIQSTKIEPFNGTTPSKGELIAVDLRALGRLIQHALEDLNPLPALLQGILGRATEVGVSRFHDVAELRDVIKMFVHQSSRRANGVEEPPDEDGAQCLTPLPVVRWW